MAIDLVRLVKPAEPPPDGAVPEDGLQGEVIEALRTVYDPEIPVNIYDLGLIYGLEIGADNRVKVVMTLTTPNCPVAESMPGTVLNTVQAIEQVESVEVELVWDPPWDPSMMTDEARLALDMFG